MFELLLLIYLIPVLFVVGMLWKFVLWVVRKVLQLAWWIVKTVFTLLGKGLYKLFVLLVADVRRTDAITG